MSSSSFRDDVRALDVARVESVGFPHVRARDIPNYLGCATDKWFSRSKNSPSVTYTQRAMTLP
jgi:hypothetical protein